MRGGIKVFVFVIYVVLDKFLNEIGLVEIKEITL